MEISFYWLIFLRFTVRLQTPNVKGMTSKIIKSLTLKCMYQEMELTEEYEKVCGSSPIKVTIY